MALLLSACVAGLAGCQIAQLFGATLQAEEEQRLIDMPARYNGLQNKTVAVVVQVDMSTQYEFPGAVPSLGDGISERLKKEVPGVRVLPFRHVLDWQFRTPQWNAMTYGEIAEQLNVDRVVHVDVLEYRLNPPGNRWLWEGACTARVGVVERESIDPDVFVETYDITAKYPTKSGIGRESVAQQTIEYGLLYRVIERASWLFHQHLEPKYPDKYRPELDPRYQKGKRR